MDGGGFVSNQLPAVGPPFSGPGFLVPHFQILRFPPLTFGPVFSVDPTVMPIFYRFRDKPIYWVKICVFATVTHRGLVWSSCIRGNWEL